MFEVVLQFLYVKEDAADSTERVVHSYWATSYVVHLRDLLATANVPLCVHVMPAVKNICSSPCRL